MFDDEFASIDGIGPEKSAKLHRLVQGRQQLRSMCSNLMKELTIEEQEPVENGQQVRWTDLRGNRRCSSLQEPQRAEGLH